MADREPKQGKIYQLKITLADIEPPVWRRIEVASGISLDQLHRIVQEAMGWHDSHLHLFEIDGVSYGPLESDGPWFEGMRDEHQARLDQVIRTEGASFAYEYDMGDGWEHVIELESVFPPRPDFRYPVCKEGERNCPPEDCGGPFGYEEFLKAIADPDHPDHTELLEWIGGSFDPRAFDMDSVNRALRNLT